jgi:hypothetical protein
MFLDQFYTEEDSGIRVSADQASHFAKDIAGDFNPIHDPDAKRFCVPGDLLFALVLSRYGVSQQMTFDFAGMVGRDIVLTFPDTDAEHFDIVGHMGKTYLKVSRSGEITKDPEIIEALIRNYVAFSGHNFPHVLMPMLEQKGVMINADRPLVIYESMSFDLKRVAVVNPKLEPAGSRFVVNGKRGDATLLFDFVSGVEVVGTGEKKLVVSGLKDYDADKAQEMIDLYETWKGSYCRA